MSKVNSPDHYNQGSLECIDAMVEAFGWEAVESFCAINAFKYVWRYKHKNGREDLNKAIWYLRFALKDDPRAHKVLQSPSSSVELDVWETIRNDISDARNMIQAGYPHQAMKSLEQGLLLIKEHIK